ncbi:MAG: hypothetical protein LBM93_07700 [Oscillospiraceae bacterium]|jgi:vacuolar-type H+-ATPase subunit H|nr:hypothetical protein [Oscillospiraceae bacterium]
MENVVKSLISIDANATERLEKAKLNNEQRIVDAKKIAIRRYNELIARADVRINKVQNYYDNLTEEELDKQQKALASELRKMDESLSDKKQDIVDNMYKAIVG